MVNVFLRLFYIFMGKNIFLMVNVFIKSSWVKSIFLMVYVFLRLIYIFMGNKHLFNG